MTVAGNLAFQPGAFSSIVQVDPSTASTTNVRGTRLWPVPWGEFLAG